MTELEALAKDCIENHTHRLVDKPTKQDIYLREESIFIQGYKQAEKRIAELEKENAELIHENARLVTVIDESKSWGISPLNNLIIKNLDDQLTKAKEYIKLLLMNCVGVYESTGKTIAEIQAEAEQFISEVKK